MCANLKICQYVYENVGPAGKGDPGCATTCALQSKKEHEFLNCLDFSGLDNHPTLPGPSHTGRVTPHFQSHPTLGESPQLRPHDFSSHVFNNIVEDVETMRQRQIGAQRRGLDVGAIPLQFYRHGTAPDRACRCWNCVLALRLGEPCCCFGCVVLNITGLDGVDPNDD